MRLRFLIFSTFVVLASLAGVGTAAAQDGSGQNTQTSAGASAAPGAVQVSAGDSQTSPSKSGQPGRTGSGTTDPPNPNQPYGCTYTVPPLSTQQLLGVGGATPGQWEFPTCAGPGVINPMPPVWVVTAQPQAPVDPAVVGQQAVSQLKMPTPTIAMAPPAGAPQLVGVAAWLWIEPGAWQALSATATAGMVTATATATPSKVVWDMGNGNQVTCDGPGTAYKASDPNATTDCSYTWTQAGPYQVTATVYWSVSWTAAGAAGGGNLGLQAGPAVEVPVTVTESQAINTATARGN
jgi:hypothetical protein